MLMSTARHLFKKTIVLLTFGLTKIALLLDKTIATQDTRDY